MVAIGRCIELVALVLLFYAVFVNAATVSYITTFAEDPENHRNGSTEGGTLLWVHGSGFAPEEFSMAPSDERPNKIEFVSGSRTYDCSMVDERISDTQLACYTPAMPPGPYQVRVYVQNSIVPLSQHTSIPLTTYTSSVSNTPIINSIVPASGSPQRMITLQGDFKSKCYLRDERDCLVENPPFISRIYVGGQLCNLMDYERDGYYSELNYTQLQCFLETFEVGIFNVTILVSNDYGRSKTNDNLLKLSGTGQTYTLDTYSVITNISFPVGSLEGGTILSIHGNYFSQSRLYPLAVNIGNDPCNIISMESNFIQCQTSMTTSNNRMHYHGGRGLHMYQENSFTNLRNLVNGTPPMPSTSASRMWIDEAAVSTSISSGTTIWFIGFVRPPIDSAYIFRLNTNVQTMLFLSNDENPSNKVMIANDTMLTSNRIVLRANTDYYLFAIGAAQSGSFRLAIETSIQSLDARVRFNPPGTSEIQQITIGNSAVDERQSISYTTTQLGTAVAEVQDVEAFLHAFQIGFRGVYTALMDGPPFVHYVQDALNDLPTIFPQSVTVALVGTAYRVTFPIEMGDVPPLTMISVGFNGTRSAVEIVRGNAPNSKIAFELDGSVTTYLPFRDENITNSMLIDEFTNLFSIKCPQSLINPLVTPSILYVSDFEDPSYFDDSSNLRDVAFCGRGSMKNSSQYLVYGNTIFADYMCFAYKIAVGNSLTMNFLLENDGNPPVLEPVPMSLISDARWHYTCIDLRLTLEQYSSSYMAVNTFIVLEANLTQFSPRTIMIDAVSLRTGLPIGYEDQLTVLDTDHSAVSPCNFPFVYDGMSYSACILDDNNVPFCGINGNTRFYCQNSSIEGVRRLFPKQKLLPNSLRINHILSQRSIDISFSYVQCKSPSLINILPSSAGQTTSQANASRAIFGSYSIDFDGSIYSPIPVVASGNNLASTLQSFSNFGYVTVNRTGECYQYSYTIKWLVNGEQPLILVANSSGVGPINTPLIVSRIQRGTSTPVFYKLPSDVMRTYHTVPQVEVLVGGYPSYCSQNNNTCEFERSSVQTPQVTLIEQNSTLVTIHGTGFGTGLQSNVISIGESGNCAVRSASATLIVCSIDNSPSGYHDLRVNVIEKGLAANSGSSQVFVPIWINTFQPMAGDAGGGYSFTITGGGFSEFSHVKIGDYPCINVSLIDYTTLRCIVPPSGISNLVQVHVSVTDRFNSTTASSRFTYNSTTLATIYSIQPTSLPIRGGLLQINGTGFGNSDIRVFIGTNQARVLSSTNSYILVNASSLSPGLYSVTVRTTNGFAAPMFYIEYKFYIQDITPRLGSAYGGADVFIRGEGFDNGTFVQLKNRNNRTSTCSILTLQSNLIHCRTTVNNSRVIITSYGSHPSYGFGYSWYPIRETVQQGTIVTWHWDSSQLLSPVSYKVEQVDSSYSNTATVNGFDSGSLTPLGSFSYQFDTVGTFHYWSPNTHSSSGYSMRGVIEVVPMESEIVSIEVFWNRFTAQKCKFPFTFGGTIYSACTSANDTQLWCSPTPVYSGQRLYCTPTASIPVSTCPLIPLNSTVCNQSTPTSSEPTDFLSTTCDIAAILSMSPLEGPMGTELTITTTGLTGNICDYAVQIGDSYMCPVTNISSTQITCQIAAQSMLDPRINHIVRVIRYHQGYLATRTQLRFKFLPSITSITPTAGSIYGGTEVKIIGDGFISEETLVIIQGTSYTHLGSTSYSEINLRTSPELVITNMDLDVDIYVRFTEAMCLIPSCVYSWDTSISPSFGSITPSRVRGTTNLTITGQNFPSGGSSNANVSININQNRCVVNHLTSTSIECTVPGVEAGEHVVNGYIEGIGNIYSLVNITSDAYISSVHPLVSSIHGGSVLTIDGHGFTSNESDVQVTVGNNPCSVIESRESQIECIIPEQGNGPNVAAIQINSHQVTFPSSFVMNYSQAITPTVTSISPTVGSGTQILTISGGNLAGVGQTFVEISDTICNVTAHTGTTVTCLISENLPAGNHTITVNVDGIGNSNNNVSYTHDLTVNTITPSESGYGGGVSSTIIGNGFNGNHVDVKICNRSCLSLRVVSNSRMNCVVPSMTVSSVDNICNVTVDVNGLEETTQFTYRTNLTSTISSISPTRGGTGGGTLITINGNSFPNSINAVSVSIAGTPCSIQSITNTRILCETGSYPYSSVRAPIIVSINGSGYAAGSVYFQYIDLWSSQWTWGGLEPPESETIVVVENQQTVYLDIKTPKLKVLVIDNASLIFEDSQDVALNSEYIILINGGRIQVGTETNPFEHRAEINLHGHLRSIELPLYGAKVLAIRDGTLDMHGKPTIRTWTHLGATATNGSTTISLLQPVNWTIGDEIVIATTGDRLSQKESEIRRIANISSNGLILTLNKPLTYTHMGITHMVNSIPLEIRAEVGLLSHNVIFQGSVTETWDDVIEPCPDGFNPDEFAVQTCFLGRYGQETGSDEFGALLTINQDSNSTNRGQVAVRLSNTEIFHVGQAFRLDRYAIHFQRNGNMRQSYVKSCSIHESYNRAIHIQATNHITFENNVIYNIMGNAIYLSDGVETGNTFRQNLAVFVRSSSSLMNEDLTPAAYWLSNPNNVVEFNAIAGCTHYGYWYRFSTTPEEASIGYFPNYCPNNQPFGRFYNNTVHSTGRFGVWIYPEYAPTLSGDCNGTDPVQATVEGVISWKNNKGIELVMSRTVQIKNALVFDNADMGIGYITADKHQDTNPMHLRSTFYQAMNGSSVIDSVIIGDAGIGVSPVVPKSGGLIVMWDRGLHVHNVLFINFASNETRAIYGPIIIERCTDRCGGWLTKFSNVSFVNVLIRGKFRWSYDGLYYDEDGSLSGQPDTIIMAPDGLTNSTLSCTTVAAFENAISCPRSRGSQLRFSFHEILERPLGRLFVYDTFGASTIVPWLFEQLTYPNGYLVVLLANQTYKLHFDSLLTPDIIRYTGVVYDVAPGDFLIFEHSMNIGPFKANTTIDRQMVLGSTSPLSGTNSSNGDWYYDQVNRIFSYIIINPITANSSMDIVISYQLYFCPCNACGCPLSTTTSTTTTTTSSATTATTTSATTVTTTSVTTTTATTSTSVTTTTVTTTTATTTTSTSSTSRTTTTATTSTTTTSTSTRYLPPIQPCQELPANSQVCQMIEVKRWSIDSDWTFGPQNYQNWYRQKPGSNLDIFIPRCIWLIIDHPLPPIKAMNIEGVVQFEQGRSHTLYIDNIILNGGRLVAGLPNATFNGNIDIIMRNTTPITIPLPPTITRLEPKMIVVYGGLDLHGTERGTTWTRLSTTALSNQNRITLSQPVNWTIGDEIVITTTDIDISHTERHRIASIQNRTTIFTVVPLLHTHRVIRQTFPNGQNVHISAAVGLLTRNVRIINENSGSSNFGFRIVVGAYDINLLHIYSNSIVSTCYKGYVRISNTQFIGYGQLDDSYNTDQRSAIYMNNLGDYNPDRANFVRDSAFDGGFNAAVAMFETHGTPITNNVIYNTFRSGLVIGGKNNLIQNNLVAKVRWLGSGQIPSVAEFNVNNDGAIMTREATSVRLLDNLVAGAERLAYRIQGESCGDPDIYIPPNITNIHLNNEAHSVMSGVNLWSIDKGFTYDRRCVLIQNFKVYKAWYYGFYINTPRNITINRCTVIDSHVGIFTYIIGPSALTHLGIASRVKIGNSTVIGSLTEQDCNDTLDRNSMNIQFSQMAIPGVADDPDSNRTNGRSGIVFPTVSRNNFMPIRSWTGIGAYPCINGLMTIANTTIAFFNDVCGRRDSAIQVSQRNDDGQFPISTSAMFVYNTTYENLIFNGKPNLAVVNPSKCGDMDCDGLKKNLITDTDGSLLGNASSAFSHAEAGWGNQRHGIGDYRIPRVAYTNLTGHRMNINLTHPYRGISRTNSCTLRPSWGMYMCERNTDYRMLIIESMDSDTERRRISPVAIMSKTGYIDLINGPQYQSFCNGYSCQKRISTFMAIVQSGQTYEIYFSSNTPKHVRFRILNADPSIKVVLALYYLSLQQIDVYSNTVYISPMNRDLRSPSIMLLDQPNNVTISSRPGSNYFDRTFQMLYFNIDGNSTIDVRMAPLLILSFGFPPISPSAFFTNNLVGNLATLFGISPERIRRVNIISASNNTRIRRQAPVGQVRLFMELRDEPRSSTTASTGIRGELLANIASAIINRYQIGELQIEWANLAITNTIFPSNLTVKEPYDDIESELSVVFALTLITPPADCRQYSPCTIQPLLVAYDSQGNVIQKLGSNDRPWKVQATIFNQTSIVLSGGIVNYTNGSTQYTQLALPDNGTYIVQFNIIQPDGVNGTLFTTRNLTAQTTVISVTRAFLSAQQVNNVYLVNRNEIFSIFVVPIDNVTRLRLGQIQWGNWQWSMAVSMFSFTSYSPGGSLFTRNGSRTVINLSAGTVSVTNLGINGTGMFILNILLTSSNNEHNISITSSGILVSADKNAVATDPQSYSSNITFTGDYNALNASNQLEITRASIYNYLISIGMPMASDLTLTEGLNGTIVALFEVAPPPTNISNAVSILLYNPNAISSITIASININTRSYTTSKPQTTENNKSESNISLIVGLSVGLGGGMIIIIIVILNYIVQNILKADQVAATITNQQSINNTVNMESTNVSNTTQPRIIWFK